MTINCIIIDDEPLARKGLKEYISEVDYLHLLGDFDSPLQSTDLIARGQVQLIFLDIQMPRITGLEFMKTMQNMPLVIFTTAYPNYAVEGFELNAMDYLVKPVSFDRFLKAVHKIKEYYEVRERNVTETTTSSGYFFIKADNKLVKIFYDDVLLVEGLQNYVSIHTRQGKYITYLTFKSVEDYLPADKFIKVHKSYIISAEKIDSIEGNEVRILHHRVPISRTLKDEVLQKLLKGKFLKR